MDSKEIQIQQVPWLQSRQPGQNKNINWKGHLHKGTYDYQTCLRCKMLCLNTTRYLNYISHFWQVCCSKVSLHEQHFQFLKDTRLIKVVDTPDICQTLGPQRLFAKQAHSDAHCQRRRSQHNCLSVSLFPDPRINSQNSKVYFC